MEAVCKYHVTRTSSENLTSYFCVKPRVARGKTGYLPVDDKINAIQALATDRIVMKESGYLEIFVNNDSKTPVYYDNMMVRHSAGNVLEVNAYYPFGGLIAGLSEVSMYAPNSYKFQSMEEIKEMALNWLYTPARIYDPFIGRTTTPDPMAEWRYSISPYSFFSNNPVNRVDPTGMLDWDWLKDLKDKIKDFFSGSRVIPEAQVDMSTFDTEKDRIGLSEVEVVAQGPSKPPSRFMNFISFFDRGGSGGSQRSGYTFYDRNKQGEGTRQQATEGGNKMLDVTDLPTGFGGRRFQRPKPGSLTAAEGVKNVMDIVNESNANVKESTGDRTTTGGQSIPDEWTTTHDYHINHSTDTVSADHGGRYAPRDTMGVWTTRTHSSSASGIPRYTPYPSKIK